MTVKGGDCVLSIKTGMRPGRRGLVWGKEPGGGGGGDGNMSNWGMHTIRVEPEKPILLLLIGPDIDQSCCPFCTIDVLELFQKDLNFLSIWSVLGDEMEALGIFDRCRRLISVEGARHIRYGNG